LSINDELVKRISERTGKSEAEVQTEQLEIPDDIAQEVAEDTGFTLAAVKRSKMAIINVTSKSFGVVAINQKNQEMVVNLVSKNTTVPADVTDRFGTHLANQDTVDIRIMEYFFKK